MDESNPQVHDIEAINVDHDHVGIAFEKSGSRDVFQLKLAQVTALISVLMQKLMERNSADASALLEQFAIKRISAQSAPDGTPMLEYQLVNGLAFGAELQSFELEALYLSLGKLLANDGSRSVH